MSDSSSDNELHPDDQDLLVRYGVSSANEDQNKGKGRVSDETTHSASSRQPSSTTVMDWEPMEQTEPREQDTEPPDEEDEIIYETYEELMAPMAPPAPPPSRGVRKMSMRGINRINAFHPPARAASRGIGFKSIGGKDFRRLHPTPDPVRSSYSDDRASAASTSSTPLRDFGYSANRNQKVKGPQRAVTDDLVYDPSDAENWRAETPGSRTNYRTPGPPHHSPGQNPRVSSWKPPYRPSPWSRNSNFRRRAFTSGSQYSQISYLDMIPEEHIPISDGSHLITTKTVKTPSLVRWRVRKNLSKRTRDALRKISAIDDVLKEEVCPSLLVSHVVTELRPGEYEIIRDEERDSDEEERNPLEQEDLIRMSPTPDVAPRAPLYARKSTSVSSNLSEEDELLSEDSADSEPEPEPGPELEPGDAPTPLNVYEMEDISSPPPQRIYDRLNRIIGFNATKLPFLRRNLRLSFHSAFIASLSKGCPLPRIPKVAPDRLPIIQWEYQLQESTDGQEESLLKWTTTQTGWLCQMCSAFPAFKLDSALLFHIERDHKEVTVTMVRNKIFISLLDPDISQLGGDNDSQLQERSSTDELGSRAVPIVIPAPSPFDTPDSEVAVKQEATQETFEFDEQESVPRTQENLEWEKCVQLGRYRVGGVRIYDRVMRDMPLPLQGISAQEHRNDEEDLCFYNKGLESDAALSIMWGRWIARWSLAFRQNPKKNIEQFIKGYWNLIQEVGGVNGLVKLLLTLKFHNHISQADAYELSKEYQELCRNVSTSSI